MQEATDILFKAVVNFREVLEELNLNPDKMTLLISTKDGTRLEHILTQREHIYITPQTDLRASKPKADHHIREFSIQGLKFQYKFKPYLFPNGIVR